MNEKKKLIVILVVVALFILGVVGFAIYKNEVSKAMFKAVEEKFNGEENELIYLGRPTCGYCALLNPSLEDMQERYGVEYTYVNTDKINDKYLNKILELLGITKFGTPYLVVVSNGQVVDAYPEYGDYDVIFEFLQENGIIAEDAKLLLNYIGIEEYKNLIKSEEPKIIVVGQSTCQYCVKAKVVLNNIAANGTEINYLNISYLSKTEENNELEEFYESFEYFTNEEWGTPLTLIVKDGKIVNILEQLVSEEEYIVFFEENGVL